MSSAENNAEDEDGGSGSRTPSVTSADGFPSPHHQEFAQRQEVAAYSRLDADARSTASSSFVDADDDGSRNSLPPLPDHETRRGTLASAVFNLLSTMVGGGSLSLPLAFVQSGNALVGPACLVIMACVSEFCMRCLVDGGMEAAETGERERKFSARRRRRGGEGVQGDGDGDRDGDGDGDGDGEENHNDDDEDETDPRRKGRITYELIASLAFGARSLYLSMALIAVICFFATVGYAVLLRDLLEPYVDYLVPPAEGAGGGPTVARNVGMWLVVLGVTPLCRLTELTKLRHVGAMSMVAVLTLGFCVAYRSWECNFSPSSSDDADGSNSTYSGITHGHGSHDDDARFGAYSAYLGANDHHGSSGNNAHIHPRRDDHWLDYLTFVPRSVSSFLSALPIYVSCFICHYNVPPVCNELIHPTQSRCYAVIRYTVWSAFAFYLLVGFAGSMYGNCTPSGTVQGNVLLDFDEDDPLLLVGRTALACTVTLAFPMLVIPPRDIALRGWGMWRLRRERARLEEIEFRHVANENGRANHGGNDEEDDDEEDQERHSKEGSGGGFSGLLRRGRGQTHPPSGAFPPTLSVSEDEIGVTMTTATDGGSVDGNALTEPLLREEERHPREDYAIPAGATAHSGHGAPSIDPAELERRLPPPHPHSLLFVAILIFWSAASAACCVKSIDVVWDLLGSSLSICLGFLIPCGSYAMLFGGKKRGGRDDEDDGDVDGDGMEGGGGGVDEEGAAAAAVEDNEGGGEVGTPSEKSDRKKLLSARTVVWVFIPLMVVCTSNAFYRTFLQK